MLSFAASPHVRLYGAVAVVALCLVSLVVFLQDSLLVEKYAKWSSSQSNHPISTHETALQHDPPPKSPPYGALVIAAQNTTDISWSDFASERWTVFPYDVDDPDNPEPKLRFPKSKGNEAMVYLSFIIDHYDDLPWSVIFVHGHREAWHQEDDIANLIDHLDRVSLGRQGYISLRCDWYPSCPAEMRPIHQDSYIWGPDVHRKATEAAIAGNWRFLFPDDKIPDTIASPCCAQFAVSRQAILRRRKADYERLREWLMNSLLEDYVSGRVIEKLWAYMFTGEAVYCPPPEQCACEWFGRCGTTNWTTPPQELGPLAEWP